MADSATIVVREVTGGSVLTRSTSASGLEEARSDVACSSTGRDGFSAGRLMDQQPRSKNAFSPLSSPVYQERQSVLTPCNNNGSIARN